MEDSGRGVEHDRELLFGGRVFELGHLLVLSPCHLQFLSNYARSFSLGSPPSMGTLRFSKTVASRMVLRSPGLSTISLPARANILSDFGQRFVSFSRSARASFSTLVRFMAFLFECFRSQASSPQPVILQALAIALPIGSSACQSRISTRKI